MAIYESVSESVSQLWPSLRHVYRVRESALGPLSQTWVKSTFSVCQVSLTGGVLQQEGPARQVDVLLSGGSGQPQVRPHHVPGSTNHRGGGQDVGRGRRSGPEAGNEVRVTGALTEWLAGRSGAAWRRAALRAGLPFAGDGLGISLPRAGWSGGSSTEGLEQGVRLVLGEGHQPAGVLLGGILNLKLISYNNVPKLPPRGRRRPLHGAAVVCLAGVQPHAFCVEGRAVVLQGSGAALPHVPAGASWRAEQLRAGRGGPGEGSSLWGSREQPHGSL